MTKILRLTLFKFTDPESIPAVLAKYSTLAQDAKKDGKAYIQMAAANRTHDDARNQGYNMVARTAFESKDAMDYYDNECEAHAEIKAMLKPKLAGPPLMVYMDAQV